ncbi:MAG: GFA family protein [Hyphomonadaceae bacterium]
MNRPDLPPPPYRGGCLCGAARWRYDARPLTLTACHCGDCKKLSGSDYALMMTARSEALVHETGETQAFVKRADSGREVKIVRCAQCGTRLWHEPLAAPALAFICAGTMDDPSWFIPTSHIWAEQASANVCFADDALRIEGQPADRQVTLDAFARIFPE